MLTFDLQPQKCYLLKSAFGMYNLERQLWYWHLLMRHCSCNLLPEPTYPMNIERNFEATLWRHWWRHHHKKLFCGIIWDDLFISEVRLKLCLIFKKIQNGRHFELPTNFFIESYTGSWIPEWQPWAYPTFWAFDRSSNSNIDGDISISKFDLFCDLVTSSMMSWIYINIIVVIISRYLFTGSIMMISLIAFYSYHEKCCYFIYKGI